MEKGRSFRISIALACAVNLAGLAVQPAGAAMEPVPAPPATVPAAPARSYRPPPLAIWLTPAVGNFGKMLSAGGDLRFALASGWGASFSVSGGEEFCLWCGHPPEKFAAGALLFGFRGVDRMGFLSIGIGPNFGSAEYPKPGVSGIRDPSCPVNYDCDDLPPPKESTEGIGVQAQAQAVLSAKYAGIGLQLNLIHIPGKTFGGLSLILPFGYIK